MDTWVHCFLQKRHLNLNWGNARITFLLSATVKWFKTAQVNTHYTSDAPHFRCNFKNDLFFLNTLTPG